MAWSSSPVVTWPVWRIGGASPATSSSQDARGADTIFAIGFTQFGALTCSDSTGTNSYSTAINNSSSNYIFYCQNATVNASLSININGPGFMGGTAAAFSGGLLSGTILDGTPTGNNGGFTATQAPGSLTTTASGDLVITGLTCETGSSPGAVSVDSGFSSPIGGNDGFGDHCSMAYLVQSAAGAVNPTWSGLSNNGQAWFTTQAAFKAAGGAPPSFNPGWANAATRMLGMGMAA